MRNPYLEWEHGTVTITTGDTDFTLYFNETGMIRERKSQAMDPPRKYGEIEVRTLSMMEVVK